MPKSRKKPTIIKALVFTDEPARLIEFSKFINGKTDWLKISYEDRKNPQMTIDNPKGAMQASIGDYIVKGVNGEFYPVKADVFEKTYEKIGENKYVERQS